MFLEEGWLEKTIQHSKNYGWDVLGNRVYNPDGTRYWDRATLNPHSLVDYSEPAGTPNLYQSSAFFLVRKHVFEKVRWDEGKLVYADREGKIPEDIQYSRDLQNNGFSFHFNSEALVWHNDDSYTEFSFGAGSTTLKKDVLRERHNMHFFLPEDIEFETLLEKLSA